MPLLDVLEWVAHVDLDDDADSTKLSFGGFPRPDDDIRDGRLEYLLVTPPSITGETESCPDVNDQVSVAPPLQGAEELSDVLHLEEVCLSEDVGPLSAL